MSPDEILETEIRDQYGDALEEIRHDIIENDLIDRLLDLAGIDPETWKGIR